MDAEKSCVVTGASGGIGRGIVTELLRYGWAVVGLDIADSPAAQGHVTFGSYRSVFGDVADASAHRVAAIAAEELAPLGGW